MYEQVLRAPLEVELNKEYRVLFAADEAQGGGVLLGKGIVTSQRQITEHYFLYTVWVTEVGEGSEGFVPGEFVEVTKGSLSEL